ncbi:MAG TPA: lysylphosphatidylglycerol synthase transmembrane domain-containing protein [Acidimicrobiales bacterium]|nr:lysylphosphatidylglycerol synthase transmembrane domain-containing protein [Acidimicrobiales bacterium]
MRPWRAALLVALAAGTVALLGEAGGPMLSKSVRTLDHLNWAWVPLAVAAEAGSMAAFARSQRRLLRAGGGSRLPMGSVLAVTYAGNAVSASLPFSGSGLATGYTYRRYNERGINAAVAAWALAVSGMFSSFAFALVLAGGAVASRSATATSLGLTAAALALLPSLVVVAALRSMAARRRLNAAFARLTRLARRASGHPRPGAEGSFERLLDRMATLRLPGRQYAEVLGLAVWNWAADCLCLAAAIRATGSHVPWHGLLLAYGAGMSAGSIGLTPGGLGVIEAALAAALTATGISGEHALAAVLVYRLVSFWLVMACGWGAMAALAHQHRRAEARRARRAASQGQTVATRDVR